MKIIRYILAAALLAAALPLTAAVQKGTDHLKTQIKPEGGRVIPDLRNAGPIWKSVTPLRTTSKQWGTLQRAVRPDETVMALATEHGLKVHELQFADNGTLSFISGELGGAAQLKSASTAARTLQSAVQSTQALRDLRLAQQWLETFAPALKLDSRLPNSRSAATRPMRWGCATSACSSSTGACRSGPMSFTSISMPETRFTPSTAATPRRRPPSIRLHPGSAASKPSPQAAPISPQRECSARFQPA